MLRRKSDAYAWSGLASRLPHDVVVLLHMQLSSQQDFSHVQYEVGRGRSLLEDSMIEWKLVPAGEGAGG